MEPVPKAGPCSTAGADRMVMKFALVRLAGDEWKFLWSIPALLLDGWSWPVVFRDASRFYEAFSQGLSRPQLDPVRPYRDYVTWLNGHSSTEAGQFWRANLADFESRPIFQASHRITLRRRDAFPGGSSQFPGGASAPGNRPPTPGNAEHTGAGGLGDIPRTAEREGRCSVRRRFLRTPNLTFRSRVDRRTVR